MDEAVNERRYESHAMLVHFIVKISFNCLILIRWVALHGTEIAYMAAEPTDSTKDMVITKCQILPSTVVNRDDIEVFFMFALT